MEADPDAELMLRLKNGEDWILNELMTRWQQPLVAFIYRNAASLRSAREVFDLALYHCGQSLPKLFAVAAAAGRVGLRNLGYGRRQAR